MKYFRVPVVYTASSLLVDRLAERQEEERLLENTLNRYFTDKKYEKCALTEVVNGIVEKILLQEETENTAGISAMEIRKKEKIANSLLGIVPEAQLNKAVALLWEEVLTYSIPGIDPIPVTLGAEEEAADIRIGEADTEETLTKKCTELAQEIARRKIGASFSLSGLWSLGMAIVGDKDGLLEKTFYLGIASPEKMLTVSEIIGADSKHPIIIEMIIDGKKKKNEDITAYQKISSQTAFISALRYAIVLYNNVKCVPVKERNAAIVEAAKQCMQVECAEEHGVRLLLNLMAVKLLEEVGVTDSTTHVLLIDAAENTIKIGNTYKKEEALHKKYLELGMHIFGSVERAVASGPIRSEVCQQIVRTAGMLSVRSDLVNELAEEKEWIRNISIIQKYLISCNPPQSEIRTGKIDSVWVHRSIKKPGNTINQDKTIVEKEESKEKNGKKGKVMVPARIRYVDRLVEKNDPIYSGESVVITVGIPREIKEVLEVVLCVEDRKVRMRKGKVRLTLRNNTSSVRVVELKEVEAHTMHGIIIMKLNREISVLSEEYISPALYYSKSVSPYGMTRIITRGVGSRNEDVLITSVESTEGYKNVKKRVFYGIDWKGRGIRIVTEHTFIKARTPRVSYRVLKNADIKYKVLGYHRKVQVVNGKRIKKDVIRVLNRRKTTEETDDTILESGQLMTDVERGIYSLISHSKIEVPCDPLSQVIRYYFYKKNGLTDILQPFKPIDDISMLERFPPYAGLSPIIIIHLHNTIAVLKIPLDKYLDRQYSLLGKWDAVSALRSHCLFESKAVRLDRLLNILRMASPGGRSIQTRRMPRNRKYWYIKEGIVCASEQADGRTLIYIQNHSVHSSIVGIIGMKITNIRPLETVIYKSRNPLDSLNILINTL